MSTTNDPKQQRDISTALECAQLFQRACETSEEIRARLADVARDLRLAATREPNAAPLLKLADAFDVHASKSTQP